MQTNTITASSGRGIRRLVLAGVLATAAAFGTVAVSGTVSPDSAQAATANLAARVNTFVTNHPAGTEVGNGQCVTLIHAYDQGVLGWSESGTPGDTGAHEWWDDFSAKPGLSAHYTKVAKSAAAKKGDLAVYGPAVGGGYGHIAIVLNDNGDTLKVIQQNWTKSLHVSIDSSMTKNHLLGYLRPKA